MKFKAASVGAADNFFANYLGLQRTTECWSAGSNSCFYVTPYQDIEIAPEETGDGALDSIGVWTEDAVALHEYLAARGVHPGNLVVTPSGLQYFELSDPEQHRLRFVSKKSPLHTLPEPETQISHHMIHAGFIVRNPSAMNHLYKDVLGFHVYWHGGMEDGQTDWVDVQVPDGTDWIEFMLHVPDNADKQTLGIMNHIALGVRDVRAAAKELDSKGMKLTEQPQIGRDGKWQLNLYDPDGTRIELMEFMPVEKPCCSEYTGPHPRP